LRKNPSNIEKTLTDRSGADAVFRRKIKNARTPRVSRNPNRAKNAPLAQHHPLPSHCAQDTALAGAKELLAALQKLP
jgi:hypothetical protein